MRRAAFHARRLVAGRGSLDAKVTLGYRFAVASDIDNSKRTNHNAELATDAQIRVNQHGTFRILPVNRLGWTNRNTRRILTVPALQRHCKLPCRLNRYSSLGLWLLPYRFFENARFGMRHRTGHLAALAR
jgi:hypothetical protein